MSHLLFGFLLLVVGAAVFVGVLLVRRFRPGLAELDSGPSSGVLSYVAAAFGILLGFVIVFLLGQVGNARQATGDEATSIGTAFDEAQLFPEVEPELQHALICYSRAVTEIEWPALDGGGSAPEADDAYRTLIAAYGDATESTAGTFQPATATNSFAQLGAISTARETRLVAAEPAIGPIMWILLVGAAVFLLILLFVISASARPLGQALLLGLAGVFTAALFALTIDLGRPFSDSGPVAPDLIEDNTARMVALAPEAAAAPCAFDDANG